MSVPAELRGVWRRVGLEVGGSALEVSGCTVLWLQSEETFVDVRVFVGAGSPSPGEEGWAAAEPAPAPSAPGAPAPHVPLSGPTAFAGRAHWQPPTLTWVHDLDLHPGGGCDLGQLHWDDGLLVEQGIACLGGQRTGYVERWERVAGTEVPVVCRTPSDTVRLETETLAVQLTLTPPGRGSIERRRSRDESWQTVHVVAGELRSSSCDAPCV